MSLACRFACTGSGGAIWISSPCRSSYLYPSSGSCANSFAVISLVVTIAVVLHLGVRPTFASAKEFCDRKPKAGHHVAAVEDVSLLQDFGPTVGVLGGDRVVRLIHEQDRSRPSLVVCLHLLPPFAPPVRR